MEFPNDFTCNLPSPTVPIVIQPVSWAVSNTEEAGSENMADDDKNTDDLSVYQSAVPSVHIRGINDEFIIMFLQYLIELLVIFLFANIRSAKMFLDLIYYLEKKKSYIYS